MNCSVLVFPSGTEIASEVARGLKFKKGIRLIGINSIVDASLHNYPEVHLLGSSITEPDFKEKFEQITERLQPDVIYPAHDEASVVISALFEQGKLGSAKVVSSKNKTCEIVRSKSTTYERLESVIPVPVVYSTNGKILKEPISFPLFAKPDKGQGSKGTQIINSAEELKLAVQRKLVVTEYLPGKEFTVDCFTNNSGKLIFCQGRERSLTTNGITSSAVLSSDGSFRQLAEAINENMELCGPWFFQVKARQGGEYVLLEIASRIAGSSGINRFNGVNLPLAGIYNALGYDVQFHQQNSFHSSRRILSDHLLPITVPEGFVVDFDDTLLYQEKLNWKLIGILGSLQQRGCWIDIVSRHSATHSDSLSDSILNSGLPLGIFRSIHDIGLTDKKSNYIPGDNVGFVDDSFTERKEVASRHPCLIFDVQEFISYYSSLW
jgi:carbamoyl-phosphate synthase large subunit